MVTLWQTFMLCHLNFGGEWGHTAVFKNLFTSLLHFNFKVLVFLLFMFDN